MCSRTKMAREPFKLRSAYPFHPFNIRTENHAGIVSETNIGTKRDPVRPVDKKSLARQERPGNFPAFAIGRVPFRISRSPTAAVLAARAVVAEHKEPVGAEFIFTRANFREVRKARRIREKIKELGLGAR